MPARQGRVAYEQQRRAANFPARRLPKYRD
jgi:hypothetical protein